MKLAISAGFKDIVLLGPSKTPETLRFAIENKVPIIVIESLRELDIISEIMEDVKAVSTHFIFRITPPWGMEKALESMTAPDAKFGIPLDKIRGAVERAEKLGIGIEGFHYYLGSQIMDDEYLLQRNIDVLSRILKTSKRLGLPIKILDMGGGFGIPYSEDDGEFNIDRFMERLFKFLALQIPQHRGVFDEETKLFFEAGRYLVGEAGLFLAEVIDVKDRGKKIVIVNTGMNGFLRPAFIQKHPIIIANRLDEYDSLVRADIHGFLCTPLDVFGEDVPVPATIKVGDIICILNAGAYGFSMSPLNFLSHEWPLELVIDNGKVLETHRKRISSYDFYVNCLYKGQWAL